MQDTLESVKNFLKSILFALSVTIKGLFTFIMFVGGVFISVIQSILEVFAITVMIISMPILRGRENED